MGTDYRPTMGRGRKKTESMLHCRDAYQNEHLIGTEVAFNIHRTDIVVSIRSQTPETNHPNIIPYHAAQATPQRQTITRVRISLIILIRSYTQAVHRYTCVIHDH